MKKVSAKIPVSLKKRFDERIKREGRLACGTLGLIIDLYIDEKYPNIEVEGDEE